MNISEHIAAAVRAHGRLFITAVLTVALVAWTAVGASAWFVRGVVTGLPDREDLRGIGTMPTSTTLLDVDDRPAFTIYEEQRIEVPLSRVSPHLQRAMLAIEDQRFYDHGGMDIVRVAGALVTNVRQGRVAEGGSTLTQQLARQSFLSSEKTIRRKLKELIVAARIESAFTKNEILELYLNKVYFGDGLYGVEAASRGYFGKHAADLDVAESALLAGLVKSPSSYAPTVDMQRAVSRRNVVLRAMRGSKAIDGPTYDAAVQQKVELNDTLRNEEPYGQYFKEEVRKQLVQTFGWDRVYQGGLKVYTTLDLDLQKAAETEVARGLEDIEERQARSRRRNEPEPAEPLQAALVAMDPATGEVRAMVGGRSFDESRFNRATQARRQPGSAFKPFVYAAALERGFTPATVLAGLNDPISTPQGDWVPEDGHSTGTSMTVRTALRTSSNRAAARMLQEVGIPATVRYAERLGLGAMPGVPSLALGSGEVTLMSMAAAFAAFASEGMVPSPTLIRRVETTEGEVLLDGGQPPQRAISEATAYLMTHMMADVVDSGTAWTARRVGFRLPAAGKTGTTNDYYDAWFVGYTPNIVTGVWVGYDQPQTIVRNGYAAELAVPIWGRFMTTATRGDGRDWFEAPPTVTSRTICRITGKLATEHCRNVQSVDEDGYLSSVSTAYTEHFIRGTEPTEYCDLHERYEYIPDRMIATTGEGDPEPSTPATLGRRGRVITMAPGEAPTLAGGIPEAEPGIEPETAEPSERRGFWSRIFGRRGNNDERPEP